jgi:2-polyprenyl-6-methoxyphenol hydroxylase-like FAD-dependent oxidoreductase
MAILDVIELAAGLCECYGKPGTEYRLAGYTAKRMPEIWRYEEFSNWMLSVLHAKHEARADGNAGAENFAFGLRGGRPSARSACGWEALTPRLARDHHVSLSEHGRFGGKLVRGHRG